MDLLHPYSYMVRVYYMMYLCHLGFSKFVRSRTWRSSEASPVGPIPPYTYKWFKNFYRLSKYLTEKFVTVYTTVQSSTTRYKGQLLKMLSFS